MNRTGLEEMLSQIPPDVAERYARVHDDAQRRIKAKAKRAIIRIAISALLAFLVAIAFGNLTGVIIGLAGFALHGFVLSFILWRDMGKDVDRAMEELKEVERYWGARDSFR